MNECPGRRALGHPTARLLLFDLHLLLQNEPFLRLSVKELL